MKCFVNSNKSHTFAPAIENDALLAQLVEQLTLKVGPGFESLRVYVH